jgi:hypothetical protein
MPNILTSPKTESSASAVPVTLHSLSAQNPSLDYTCISGTDRCPALSRYRGNRRELLAAYEGFLEVQGPLN